MAFRVSALRLPSHPLYYTFSLSLSVSLRLSHPPFRGRKYSYRDDESVCGEIQTVSIVIFGKFVGFPVPDIFFNRVRDQRRGECILFRIRLYSFQERKDTFSRWNSAFTASKQYFKLLFKVLFMPESVTLHENGTQRRFYFHKKIEETTSRTLSIFVHSARSLQRSRAVYISPFLFFPFPSLHSPLSPSLAGLVRVLFRPPCGEPANLLYTEFLVCRHTLRVSTLSVSPFLDVYICICVPPFPSPPPFSLSSVLPPRKPRRSSFFLSHFSTPFPVSSREYKKGWAHECLVTLSAFLIPPPYPTSAFACPACSSLSLYFSPTSNNHIYIYIYTYACFFYFFLLLPSFFSYFSFFFSSFLASRPSSLRLCTL